MLWMLLVAFAITAISQTYLVIRHRGYFMLAMLIAEFSKPLYTSDAKSV